MLTLFRTLFAPPRDIILIVAALWIGLALAEKRSERHSVSKDALNNLVFYSLFGFLIGGRIFFALTNYSAFVESPLNIFSLNIDLFDSTSGFLVAALVGIIYGRKQNLPFWGALDALTPIFAFLAIGLHLSHLAAGTAFGAPTDLPWGIDIWNATRHPTQIYELIAALIIFGIIWFRKTNISPGVLFLDFVALTAGARLFLEAFRGDSVLVFGEFRLAQIVAWTALAIAFLGLEYASIISKERRFDETE
ncbi:MAG: Prolipoprotein diacylglyceryl transferase [Anaerolineales bacterium]|nr:Prolipoprotein diacylglyceryl transferase [Anaerolineales bacterium]WKZ48425.1 MAG: prolipoprotein diacylglyceryl transferase [Anaerolineales bacterium]